MVLHWRGRSPRAQQSDQVRRVGVAMHMSSDDPEGQVRLAAFRQALQELGWTVGRNLQIDYRWGTGDAGLNRRNAAELVALAPDVILATGTPTLEPLLQVTRTMPIVFVQAIDPVGAGVIESLARPGGNATGFTTSDPGTSGKWLELLKEIAPNVKRVAVLRDTATTGGIGQWAAIQAMVPSFGVELRPVGLSDSAEIERGLATFARDSNGGLIVTLSGPSIVHRRQIIELAARYRLPAVYGQRFFVTEGGLISYGHDAIDPYRRAVSAKLRLAAPAPKAKDSTNMVPAWGQSSAEPVNALTSALTPARRFPVVMPVLKDQEPMCDRLVMCTPAMKPTHAVTARPGMRWANSPSVPA